MQREVKIQVFELSCSFLSKNIFLVWKKFLYLVPKMNGIRRRNRGEKQGVLSDSIGNFKRRFGERVLCDAFEETILQVGKTLAPYLRLCHKYINNKILFVSSNENIFSIMEPEKSTTIWIDSRWWHCRYFLTQSIKVCYRLPDLRHGFSDDVAFIDSILRFRRGDLGKRFYE
jgi:hypothetical protein